MLTDVTHTILTIVHKQLKVFISAQKKKKKKESMTISNCMSHLLCLKKEKEWEKESEKEIKEKQRGLIIWPWTFAEV